VYDKNRTVRVVKDTIGIGTIGEPVQPTVLMRRYDNEITILCRLRNLSTERAISKIGIAGYLVFSDFRGQGRECVFNASAMPDDGAARMQTPQVVKGIGFLINMEQRQLCPKYSGKRYRY
jgi:hypothetical protein